MNWDDWDEKKKTFKLQANSGFVPQVADALKKQGLGKDSTIMWFVNHFGFVALL